jgi:AcrR family transcriptional regulator
MYARPVARLPAHLKGSSAGEERLSRSVLARHQRERVLANVIPVLAKRGYQATTVDDLLAAGKVGVGNFYSLFEGKEDCFLAAFDWVLAGIRVRVDAAHRDAKSWSEGAVLGLRELIVSVCAEPAAARIVLVEAQAAGPTATARYEGLLDEVTAKLRSGRRRGVAQPDLPERFEETAIAGLAYYLQQCLLGTDIPDPAVLLAEVAPLVLEPIVGAAELRGLIAANPVR